MDEDQRARLGRGVESRRGTVEIPKSGRPQRDPGEAGPLYRR
jgi:hypothetical protein